MAPFAPVLRRPLVAEFFRQLASPLNLILVGGAVMTMAMMDAVAQGLTILVMAVAVVCVAAARKVRLAPGPPVRHPWSARSQRTLAAALLVGLVTVVAIQLGGGPPRMVFEALLLAFALAVLALPDGITALAQGLAGKTRQRLVARGVEADDAGGVDAVSLLAAGPATGLLAQGLLTQGQAIVRSASVPSGNERNLWRAALLCEGDDGLGDAAARHAANLGHSVAGAQRLAERAPAPDGQDPIRATVTASMRGPILTIQGPPAAVLARCRACPEAESLRREAAAYASQGLEAIAYAGAQTDDLAAGGLHPLGVVALEDPVRPGARAGVSTCRSAGLAPVLLTRSSAAAARRQAAEAGLPAAPLADMAELRRLPAEARRPILAAAAAVASATDGDVQEWVRARQAAGLRVGLAFAADAPAATAATAGAADLKVAVGGGAGLAAPPGGLACPSLEALAAAAAEARAPQPRLARPARLAWWAAGAATLAVAGGLALMPEPMVPLTASAALFLALVAALLGAALLRGGAEAPARPGWGLPGLFAALAVVGGAAVVRIQGGSAAELQAQFAIGLACAFVALALLAARPARATGGWRAEPWLLSSSLALLAALAAAGMLPPLAEGLGIAGATGTTWGLALAGAAFTFGAVRLGWLFAALAQPRPQAVVKAQPVAVQD